tara:strand:+ start:238 stop:441 length:204 start_codon:yes stop_codon:yes gene_type:complete
MKYKPGTLFTIAFQIEGCWMVEYSSKVEARSAEEAVKKVKADVPRSYGHYVESIQGTLGPKKSKGVA